MNVCTHYFGANFLVGRVFPAALRQLQWQESGEPSEGGQEAPRMRTPCGRLSPWHQVSDPHMREEREKARKSRVFPPLMTFQRIFHETMSLTFF